MCEIFLFNSVVKTFMNFRTTYENTLELFLSPTPSNGSPNRSTLFRWNFRLIQLSLYIIFRVVTGSNAYLPIIFIKWYMMCPISIPGLEYVSNHIYLYLIRLLRIFHWNLMFFLPIYSVQSHPGYEIVMFYYFFFYYYFLSGLHFYDSYFYFFSMYVVMKSKLFCSLASHIGDYNSNFNTPRKQKKLLYHLCVLHQEINKYWDQIKNSIQYYFECENISVNNGIVSDLQILSLRIRLSLYLERDWCR